jgi:hypothetical protein
MIRRNKTVLPEPLPATRPEMSGVTFDDLPPIFAEFAGNFFRNIIWYELNQRPKAIEEFDTQLGVAALLNRVQEIAGDPELGDELILLVPNDPFGNAIYMTTSGLPTEGLESYGLTREAGAESGVGCMYVGTIGKIHIYTWQFPDAAFLCSRTLLRAAHFGRVHDLDAIFDFQLYDSGDPTESMVRMWLVNEFEWEDRLVIEFRFSNLAEGALEGEDNPDA